MSTAQSSPLHQVLDLMPDAILLLQDDGRIVFANTQAETLLGHRRHDLLGQAVEALLPGALGAVRAARGSPAAATPTRHGRGQGLLLQARRHDGSDVAVDVSLAPIEGDSGPLVIACVHDLTERTELAERLKTSEARYRMLVENASEVFYQVKFDEDALRGAVEFVSPQCEVLTGRPPADFIENQSLWIDLVHDDDRRELFESTQTMLTEGREQTRYYRIRHNGEFRSIADRVVPLLGSSGRVVGYQGAARDISERVRREHERERLEGQLRQAQKMETVGRLAGGVAHDLNNLLTVVFACCEAAVDRLEPTNAIRTDLQEIEEAGKRAANLVRQLLAFSRQQVVAPRLLDVNVHLEGLQGLLRRTLPENIASTFSLAPELWPVRVDPSQFDQIVLNLAVNSRDAMPDGGTLTLRTANVVLDVDWCQKHVGAVPGEYVEVGVTDSGHGMDEATLEHVFEPFFTTKPEGRGTGLGLASVYGIVKQNNGFVDVESEVGVGTTVRVWLPRSLEAGQTVVSRATGHQTGHETILLVEDDDHVRFVTRRLLEQLGYRVLEAANPAAALALCQSYADDIHVLLTDLVMPLMSGAALSERVEAERPRIRTLLMSGYAAGTAKPDTAVPSRLPFLQKPFDKRELANALRRALEGEGR